MPQEIARFLGGWLVYPFVSKKYSTGQMRAKIQRRTPIPGILRFSRTVILQPLIYLALRAGRDSKDQIAICRWHIAATSSKTGCYLNFCPSHGRAKMQTSPFRVATTSPPPHKDGYFDRVTVLIVFWLKPLTFQSFPNFLENY